MRSIVPSGFYLLKRFHEFPSILVMDTQRSSIDVKIFEGESRKEIFINLIKMFSSKHEKLCAGKNEICQLCK